MDPTVLVALVVAVQVIYQAWSKYRTERPKVVADSAASLSGAVDDRLRILINLQSEEIARLREELEGKNEG